MCGNAFYGIASCKMNIHNEKLFNYVKILKVCKKKHESSFSEVFRNLRLAVVFAGEGLVALAHSHVAVVYAGVKPWQACVS